MPQVNNKTIAILIGAAVVGFAAYKYFWDSKKHYAQVILSSGMYGSGSAALESFEKEYLKEWSKAAKSGVDTFVYAGRSFNTKGGTAKK